VAESLDVVTSGTPLSSFQYGEIATIQCARCESQRLPWDVRTFGGKSICSTCYEATLELARGALKSLTTDEPERLCSNCRALRHPEFGSAWCGVIELGNERARICANFVPLQVEKARSRVSGGRVEVIDLWEEVSEHIRSSLGSGNYETWFGQVEPVSLDGRTLTIAAPDGYTRDWLEQRLAPVVRSALALSGRPEIEPVYIVESVVPELGERREKAQAKAGFNPHYTFSEFIVGAGNRLAHASALACIDKPGRAYNPLVLYGGVGVGKTHLLQAIGQEVIDRDGGDVLYASSETFTNELIAAIRSGNTAQFRDRYRSVDYLLLDDIQFIAGKEATQEEFFHTFNALHQAGKQIVVTSDRPPSELRTLEDRLRSRFAWGMAADIQPPDFETRMAIVRAKAWAQRQELPEIVMNALAARVRGNVRELEGALNRVLAQSQLRGVEPNLDVVRTVLGEREEKRKCAPSDVLQAVATYYRVKASELVGPQRDRPIAYARQVAMYLLREDAKLSLVEIGNQLGGRNHSTVIYGCDKIGHEIKRKGRVKQDIHAVRQLVFGA